MDFKAQSTHVTIIGDNNKSSKPSFFQKIRSPFSNFSSKKPLAAGLTVLMVFALVLGVYLTRQTTQLAPQAAVDGVDITLKPSAITAAANQEFQVEVFLDTSPSNFQATAAQAKIDFDPALLELKTTALGNFLPVTLLQPQNSSGSVSFAVGSTIGEPKTGSGTIATLTFQAKTNTGSTQITFDQTSTGVTALNNTTNLARSFTPASITFGTQASPSPSSSTASPSPGASQSTANENSFTLQGPATVTNGQEFQVKVLTRSDAENSNLWNATITFPKNLVEVVRFDKTGTFITSWTEEFFSNTTGEISLTGGVTNPGFKTNNTNATMTTIVFKAKANGTANINLVDPSNIFRNSDNAKILQIKRNATITIGSAASPSPSATASPSPLPGVTFDNTNTKSICVGTTPNVHLQWASLGSNVYYKVTVSESATPNIGTIIYDGTNTSYDHTNPVAGQTYIYRVSARTGQNGTPNTSVQKTVTALSCSASPSPSPQPKGDGNNDGKVDLQDLSIMFTKWSPAIDIISHFRLDFDDNKRINSFDYAEMKALLIQLGVIRQ